MIRALLFTLSSLAMISASAQPANRPEPIQRATGFDGKAPWVCAHDTALVFTGQVTMSAPQGTAGIQAEAACAALAEILAAQGSGLARVVRLTAYVAHESDVLAVEMMVKARFATSPVALTLLRGPLATPGARVALEAVATSSLTTAAVQISKGAAVLPAGAKIFISGQAEKGTDLASGVRLTMAGLERSLTHLGLAKADVVQVKAFVRPFEDHAAAMKEIAAYFPSGTVPPVVLVEWQSEFFTEIELVASAKAMPAPSAGSLAYPWLPWLPKSPRYSSTCYVAAGTPLVFIGALGAEKGDAREQVKATFAQLGSILFDASAGFRSLVKATYYLGVPQARNTLGDIRDVYFDPTRPPAASALNVATLGVPGRALMVDMIAVPLK